MTSFVPRSWYEWIQRVKYATFYKCWSTEYLWKRRGMDDLFPIALMYQILEYLHDF